MAEIVNLRAKRKAAERDARRRKGDENAAKHGRTKAERRLEETWAEKARAHLEDHRRETDAPDEPTDP
ncbi:DUF4169 family protein [Cereibacter sphaeroides]|uniref:DUF4169 family protein n=1 Tax=Cereibacter sphaeroides TaxID=1063 RepID=A0AAX1UI77_CERSP|nr:DUF4169 family protein [Cereibacter sphaeroides]RHZ92964.1 DUF4169 family protein [Cereibacter sphaeroides]